MAGFAIRWVSLVFWTWREDATKTEREVPLPFKTGEYLSKRNPLQKESSEMIYGAKVMATLTYS